MIRDQLIGTWRLVTWEATTPDGETRAPFGPAPTGRLTYDRAGSMTAQVMAAGRLAFSVEDKSLASADDVKSAIATYEAYFGTYDIDEGERTVIHRVEGALFPNWVGTEQRRFVEFSGSHLVLRTPPLPYGGTTITARIVWGRVA